MKNFAKSILWIQAFSFCTFHMLSNAQEVNATVPKPTENIHINIHSGEEGASKKIKIMANGEEVHSQDIIIKNTKEKKVKPKKKAPKKTVPKKQGPPPNNYLKADDFLNNAFGWSPYIMCFTTDPRYVNKTLLPAIANPPASPPTPPATCPAPEKIIQRVVQRVIQRESKNFETKVWAGAEFVNTMGNLSTYVPPFFMGYVLGMSQAFRHLNPMSDLYFSFAGDIANTSQNVTVSGNTVLSIFYMINLDALVGYEHYLNNNRSFSYTLDGGIETGQKAFIIATPGASANNYAIALSNALVVDGSLQYAHQVNDRISILGRANLAITYGTPNNQPVYSNAGNKIDTADVNSPMVKPSISFGMRF